MSRYSFTHDVRVPPETAWAVVADHRGWGDWLPVRRVRLEIEGDPEPDGVGAVRALHTFGPPIRERVTTFEPPRRLEYQMLSGAPVRDYSGQIVLEPIAGGTRMTWTVEFRPLVPGVQLVVAAAIGTGARLLAGACERRGNG
jgi:uncharacterized protein YndB with AHSA1/START domain